MAKYIGRQQEVGIGREVTRGTLVIPSYWVPKSNYTVEDKAAKAVFAGSFGRLEGGDDAMVAQKWAEGDMEVEATDINMGLLLYALFGTDTPASVSGAYKHVYTMQQSVVPTTLSLMMNDPIGAVAPAKTLGYARAMINSFELKVELGELAKAVFGFVAMPHKDFTRQTPTYTAQNKFGHHHLTFKIAANEAALAAAAKINVQSLTLRVEKNVIRENALGTVQPVDILARSVKISGSIKLTHEDRTYRDYMMDGTTKAMRITLNNTGAVVGSTTPQIQFDLAKVHFFDWAPDNSLEEVSTQEINFEALYDITNSRLIGAETFVMNSATSY